MPNLPSRRSGALAFLIAAIALCVAAPSEAATGKRIGKAAHARSVQTTVAPVQAPSKTTVVPVAETGSVGKSGTWTSAEPGERACFRSRRKLWQAGEGWMVKTVNVCP